MDTIEQRPRGKTEAVKLRRGLFLYKQPLGKGRGSPCWYARAYLDGKPHTRSTGTTDRRLAEQRAHDLYAELTMAKLYGAGFGGGFGPSRVLTYRFDRVADQWLDDKLKETGGDRRKLRRYKDYRQVTLSQNGLARHFGHKDVATITTDDIRKYLRFAAQNSKSGKLSPGTLKAHLASLRGILNFAFEKRMIASIPPMPKVKQVDNPRSFFTLEEYETLVAAARATAEDAAEAGGDFERAAELADFIVFMVASFLRAGEWRELRQEHVEIVEGQHPHLRIHVRDGKTRPRVIATMPEAIGAYRRILARRGRDPKAYIFLPEYRNRETAMAKMRAGYDALLKAAGLTFDGFGKRRCMYSLRHTSITLRLNEEVNVFDLATNAGTSVDQIERFYSHVDPSSRVAELQKGSVRRKRQRAISPIEERLAEASGRGAASSEVRLVRAAHFFPAHAEL